MEDTKISSLVQAAFEAMQRTNASLDAVKVVHAKTAKTAKRWEKQMKRKTHDAE